MSTKNTRQKKKKATLIRSLLATAATTTMITTGGFGILPENDLTALFQQTFVEYAPPEINQFFSPFFYESIDWELSTNGGNLMQDQGTEERAVFPLNVPIAPGGRHTIDVAERYGIAQTAQIIKHGVDFVNREGTQVLSAETGKVVFAGDDSQVQYGLYEGFHGLMVIIEHDLSGFAQPIYTLYSHLSGIQVEPGQSVAKGEVLGLVGSTGTTSRNELYFEVRMNDNTYNSTRNPALWLAQPNENGALQGALAGRILDQDSQPILVEQVVLQYLEDLDQDPYYLKLYADPKMRLQAPWYETFAIGNLTPGEYKISVVIPGAGVHNEVVEIISGEVTEWEWKEPKE